MADLTLTLVDNGRSVDVQTGDVLWLKLDESPTTGYRWHVMNADPPVVAVESSDYAMAAGAGVGGGGLRIFKLRARSPGTADVVLTHHRSWEGADKALQKFKITVNVH